MKKDYPSDLSDKEWELIYEFYKDKYHRQGRPPSKNLRKRWNGIMYLLRSGCSWRMLPKEFGVWKTVYKQFFILKNSEKLEKIMHKLHKKARISQGKEASSSVMIELNLF